MIKVHQKWSELILLIILIILKLVLIILKPLSDAVYSFNQVIFLSEVLLVIWTSRWISAENFFFNKVFRLWVTPFIITSIFFIFFLNPDAELIHVYRTLFSALSKGLNPYAEPLIYHRLMDGSVSYSYFNYPPGEIPIYLLFYILLNQWNYGVLIIANLSLNLIVAFIFIKKTPDLTWEAKLPYALLLAFMNLSYSVSTVFFSLIIAGIILLDMNHNPSKIKRIALTTAISLGLIAKFFMIPFTAIYFWHKIVEKRDLYYFIDIIIILTIILLTFLPFGLINVIENTILFNLNLKERAEVTTYSFNMISSFFYYFNIQILYMPFVLIICFFIIISTKKIPLLSRFVLISALYLILFPTPEYQFIGCLFGLLILSKIADLRIEPSNASKDINFKNELILHTSNT